MAERDHKSSIIIPTMAVPDRGESLRRSIESVLAAEGVPIVVVNGSKSDNSVVDFLRSRRDIRLFFSERPGVSAARTMGRRKVDTKFFGALDDDDELLPHSICVRETPMILDESVDVVVSNGFRELDGCRQISIHRIDRFQQDPLLGLMDTCWLNSAGGLYRTSSIDPTYFEEAPDVMEWTYLAFRLAKAKRIHFLNSPSFICHLNSSNSLSKSVAYHTGAPEVLARMLSSPMPRVVRARLELKYAEALHAASTVELENANFMSAWRFHLRSLLVPSGWRYGLYTRHIVGRQFGAGSVAVWRQG